MQYIAFDSHKHYTLAVVESEDGKQSRTLKFAHAPGAVRHFLAGCEAASPVAVETIGNYYWIVDEIEAAGFKPRLVNARRAKAAMCQTNKTDKLDAQGMNRLQRTGTLPTVWIPPADVRDRRELPRTRMTFSRQRTALKNRIHADLDKYALTIPGVSDIFGVEGRRLIRERIKLLPPHTAFAVEEMLKQLEAVEERLEAFERRMKEAFAESRDLQLLRTQPGVGVILGTVIEAEVGAVDRFPSAGHLASYAGGAPRVFATGGKTRILGLRVDINHYLKWAFVEAANWICMTRAAYPERHVCRLYERIARRRGHQKAIGALVRHLAEATYWILKKKEPYREPQNATASSTKG